MNVSRRIFLSLSALAAIAFLGCATSNPADVVRVGTYNVRYATGDKGKPDAWELRRDDFAAFLRSLDLDAFGLQEVLPMQMEFLRERMPEYEFVGEFRNADRKSGEASPVVFRKSRFKALKSGTFWLSETPDVPGKKGWGAACSRVCSWLLLEDRTSGKRFCFANTHTDHVSELARKEGMLLVVKRMKDFGAGVPVVFVGDHNCNETEAPAKSVSEILDNALYVSRTPPVGPWRTWNGWRWRDSEPQIADALKLSLAARNAKPGSPDARSNDGARDGSFYDLCGGPRIDYVYVSRGVKVWDYATRGDSRPGKKQYPSDHFPIVATVEF